MAESLPSQAPLLSMRGIDKRFNGVPALLAASLEVGRSEIHALIGQNGAGKSTMIKILTGYYSRDAGEILFDGAPLQVDSPKAAQSSGISTIYQEINLVSYRSVTENICLGREKKRSGFLDWRHMHREAAEILARFDIHIDVRQSLSRYTTAIQQMVAIARAVSFQAKLVIMDEPTSSRAEGLGVLMISSEIEEIVEGSDRVFVMREGRTVAELEGAAITEDAIMAAMAET